MADYDNGVSGQVENESYCMKKSWNARNVDSMSEQMGYHNMADRANTAVPPTPVRAASKNMQNGPEAADNKYDY